MTAFKVSACPLQTIIPAFAFSPLGLFRPLFFISLLGGIFLDLFFLRTVLRNLQGMVTRLASGHTPSHSPLVKYLTRAFDWLDATKIITRPTITCSTVVFSLHARTLLLAKSPCCCLKIKDGFRPPKIRLKTVRIRDGIGMREGSHRPLHQITGVFFSLGFSTIWEPVTG